MSAQETSRHHDTPVTVVVMAVSGGGKSVVAGALAESTSWALAEGDDFHPPANVEKMRSGRALDDEDRWPWLRAIAAWIGEQERAGRSSVVTCSALKRSYRDLLRDGHPSVHFCALDVDVTTLEERVRNRAGHYMPAGLLRSQLASLQPLTVDEPGGHVNAEGAVSTVVRRVRDMLAREVASFHPPGSRS